MDAMVKPWHDELDQGTRGGWMFIGLHRIETDLPRENPLRRHPGCGGAEIRNLDNERLDILETADENGVPHPREVC